MTAASQSCPPETDFGGPMQPAGALRWVALLAVVISLTASGFLLTRHHTLSGPGDELEYYTQAARIIPFAHNFYGPGYFAILRIVHDTLGIDWFSAGKILSWLSAGAVLLSTGLIAKQVVGPRDGLLVLALVAINPHFINQSYSSLTIMYGAAWVLAAVAAVGVLDNKRNWAWLGCGFLFGLGSLVRFQSRGFLLGALAGLMIQPGVRLRRRLLLAGLLAIGGVIPGLLWAGFLQAVQGGPPKDLNYSNLFNAAGLFEEGFLGTTKTLAKYKSMWDLLSSHWTVPLKIVTYGIKETVKFPFGIAFHLVFLAAGWLLPGLIIGLSQRRYHGPWLGAFLVGLFLTGIGSLGWLHYYVPFLPFIGILVALALQQGPQNASPWMDVRRLGWTVVLGSTILLSPFIVHQLFREQEWTELQGARAFLRERLGPESVVTSTAKTVAYDTGRTFVDESDIHRPDETRNLVAILRARGITHLVVTERHTLWEFPDLKYLLEDSVPNLPPGLRRELLITSPKRLAIYQVLY